MPTPPAVHHRVSLIVFATALLLVASPARRVWAWPGAPWWSPFVVLGLLSAAAWWLGHRSPSEP